VHRSAPVLAAAVAIVSVLASAGPAGADDPLAPGDTRTIQLPMPDKWAAAQQVDVTVGTLTQQENGCLDPESKAGDDCLPDTGDLAGQLTGSVTLGLPDGAGCQRGQSADLSLLGTRTARLTAASPGVKCLFVELTFRDDALNNQAQSDSVTFGLDLVARELPAAEDPAEVPVSTDGQLDERAASDIPTGSGSATDGRDAATTSRVVTDRAADAGSGDLAAAPVGPVGTVVDQTPEGPVLDRLEAQVSVGGDGVAVQTEAATSSLQGQVLAWGSLLLGAIALGWWAFVVVLRRRREKVAA
jgi:hypothetical protein